MKVSNQRELLELAAKAVGWRVQWPDEVVREDGSSWRWNPLTDDGDALRLAVKLGIQITQYRPTDRNTVGSVSTYYDREFVESYKPAGEMAATRRAIVRAAAALGSKK